MSQDYKYANEPLSIIAVMDCLKTSNTKDEAIETGHSIKELVSIVERHHFENGGLKTVGSDSTVRRALSHLRRSGHAVELFGGTFIFPKNDQRIFGKGEDWVYCYYLTSQKKQGDTQYPCTIGRTSGGTIKSVRGYIERQTRKAVVEPPKIPLLFRTDSCVDLEGAIHRVLKLRGQQIDAPGDELFTTNHEEVLEIYDFIIHGDPNYTTNAESRNEASAERHRERLLASDNLDPLDPLEDIDLFASEESEGDDDSKAKSRRPEKYTLYFQSLIDILREEHALTNARVGLPQNWYGFPAGITGIHYGAWFRGDGQTAVYVSIDEKSFKKSERLTFFDRLEAHYGEIAAEFNLPLSWERRPEQRYSYISMCRDGDIEASDPELDAIRDWHVEYLLKFKAVFQPIIEKLLINRK